MSRYNLIIFDFDGTLVDTLPDIAYHVNSVLKDLRCGARSHEEVKRAIGWGVHELFSVLAPALARDEKKLEETVAIFRKRYNEDPVRETEAMPGVREALAGPLSSVKKAVVTNKPQDVTGRILTRLALSEYFDPVIGMHADHPPKPDPESVRFTMNKRGAAPGDTLFIGDSRVDYETAKNAGIDFIWMKNGYDDSLQGMASVRTLASAGEWSGI